MSLASKTYYVQASQSDAYRQWKSFLREGEADQQGADCALLEEVPDREVHWLSRWGVAQIDGKADFIPAHGGCVVYVSMDGIGTMSRLILSAARVMAFGPWRNLDAFQLHRGRIR